MYAGFCCSAAEIEEWSKIQVRKAVNGLDCIFCQLLGKEKIKSGGKENKRKHGHGIL